MPYEARLVDPEGDVYTVGSASERARLIARGYRDVNPEKVAPVEATPVNDSQSEPKAESQAKTAEPARGRPKQ